MTKLKEFHHIVLEEFNRRSSKDRRKKVNYILASYIGISDNAEYRKSFEFPVEYTYAQMFKEIPLTIE